MNLTEKTIAAAWRENLADLRNRQAGFDYTATEHAFNQLDVTAAPTLPATELLEAILTGPVPAHLAAELASAEAAHALAAPRAAARARHLAALADRAGESSLAGLLGRCARNPDRTAQLLETLATDGHQLHPCARTRLGWDRADCERYDLEASRPIGVRLIADRAGLLATSGADFRDHPMLAGLDLPDPVVPVPVVPVHPWQLQHRLQDAHRDLFDTGRLEVLDALIPAWPTAAIRTVCGHTAPGHLKLALGIHITSTRRDISPATAQLAPALTSAISALATGGDHTIAADTAGAWLPGTRDFTAIARSSLAEAAPPGTVVVPAAALTATSPVTGVSLAAEYAAAAPSAAAWMRTYTALVVPPVLHLAARYGIGLEAHLQNSLIAFDDHRPARLITRDLGGVRLWPPALPFRLDIPANSPILAAGMDQVRSKVAYTLFQNQLAAIIAALARDTGLDEAACWSDIADLVASLDLPGADRDAYLAERMPTKALLTMRLHPGEEVETWVDNPMAAPRR